MFPTDELEEWKRKRKENKEKGIEVKKSTQVVESHFLMIVAQTCQG